MHTPPQPPIPHPLAPSPTPYDWQRFGRHRLRSSTGVLIDSPLETQNTVWVGTLWPDPQQPGGWARMTWQPDHNHHHGWWIPARLAGGDVIEFGADHDNQPVRWYGIIDCYDAIEWLTIQGPYSDPRVAHDDAQRLLAELRYQDPLNIAIAPRPCTRHRRSTRR